MSLLLEDHGIVLLTISLQHFVKTRNEKQRDIYNSIHTFQIRPATKVPIHMRKREEKRQSTDKNKFEYGIKIRPL